MRTKIAKKRQNKALISGLCQYVKHRRKKWGIGKRLLKADRSFIRSSYKWTRLYKSADSVVHSLFSPASVVS